MSEPMTNPELGDLASALELAADILTNRLAGRDDTLHGNGSEDLLGQLEAVQPGLERLIVELRGF